LKETVMRRPLIRVAVALITFAIGLSAAGFRGLFGRAPAHDRPASVLVQNLEAAPPAAADAEREILEIMRLYAAAQTRRDASFFELVEADTYTVTLRNGTVLNREQAIALMLGGREAVTYEHEDLRVEFFGGAAVVTGWMKATVGEGEYPSSWRWRSIYIFARRHGGWKILSVTQVG
jgi:hypothetical protein